MATVYLALGSNLGDKEATIQIAIQLIGERIGKVVSRSALYITAPEGFISESDFLNGVCKVETSLLPLEVLKNTEQIERELGRTYKSEDGKYSDRVIDIDILFYDNLIVKSEKLIIPHPHITKRMFVIQPLTEIAADFMHPVEKQTILELYRKLKINTL